jgi:uncharacterized membrane protein YhaH (DUF805 family)
MNYYIHVLKNYAVVEGRARRAEYWWFVLFNLIASISLSVVDGVAGTVYLGVIYSLAVLIPSIAVGVRRLHDIGRTGWWLLIILTIVGILVILYFSVLGGDEGENEYGPDPIEEEELEYEDDDEAD